MECEHCGLEKRVADLEKDSERNQHTHKEFYGKFEELGRGQAVADERYSAIQKVDKHNSVVERMAVAERDLKSAWKQIDEIKEDIKEEK